jgi:hypothetical protein
MLILTVLPILPLLLLLTAGGLFNAYSMNI